MQSRRVLLWAALLGSTGVALGAFGAHALRPRLEAVAGGREIWETASRYQLVHAAALAALAAWMRGDDGRPSPSAAWAARLWAAGAVVFAGSLYALALGAPRILGAVTPLGGLALIAGWALAGAAALRR